MNHNLHVFHKRPRRAPAAFLALCNDGSATLDDLREAVTTLEDTERTLRRVLGGAHPLTRGIERELRIVRAKLRARETPPPRTPG